MEEGRQRPLAAAQNPAPPAARQAQVPQQAPDPPAPDPATAPQDPPAQAPPPQPVFRVGINFVRVDVIITDKNGNPVSDLQPGDFEVAEDGEPQTIETFKFIELDGGLMPGPDGPPRAIRTDSDEELEAARDDVRLFAIFLDDYHVRDNISLAARQSISRFVETQLGPSDMVGLMYPLEPIVSVRFMRNHAATQRAIEQFQGRKYDYIPRNEMEERYAHYPTEVIERIRNQVSLSALESLISRMGALKEGRKAIILVSEGYSNMLPPQLRDQNAQMPGFGNPARGSPMAGADDPNEFRAAAMASFDLMDELRDVFNAANRNNVAIYAVDPRGLSTGEFDIADNINARTSRDYLNATMDTLRVLADESDGRAIVNRNDLTLAMKQIVRDSSAYYLLGYNSTQTPTDGKFHEIKVRVRRPGLQVRARKGYWALSPTESASALAPAKPGPPKAVESALAAISQPSRGRLIRTWIGTERGENGRTKVTLVWEPTPPVAGEVARESDRPARVAVTATGSDFAPYFRGRVPSAATPPGPGSSSTAASAVPRVITFEVPPGAMQLRLAVESSSAEVLDSETREITVPDMTSPDVALGTPEIFRARTARELQQLKTDPRPVPTAVREFSRTDRLLVRVRAYGPAAAAPTLTARLLNRTGAPMSTLEFASPAAGIDPTIEVPLAGLAPGEYLIEVTAGEPGAGVQELVGFRVTG